MAPPPRRETGQRSLRHRAAAPPQLTRRAGEPSLWRAGDRLPSRVGLHLQNFSPYTWRDMELLEAGGPGSGRAGKTLWAGAATLSPGVCLVPSGWPGGVWVIGPGPAREGDAERRQAP